MSKLANEYAGIAKSFGVPEIPEGGFAFIRDAESALDSIAVLDTWLEGAGLAAWSQVMDLGDAKKMAAEIGSIAGKAIREQAERIFSNKELTRGAIGQAVVVAIPVINVFVAAGLAIFGIIKTGSKAIDYQIELMRENRREALMVQQVGFGCGELHKALPLPKGTDLFHRRSMVWLPPPPYLDNGLGFEITPAFYPAWNPYFPPEPYVPDKQVAKRSKINDMLMGWQQDAWGDPPTIMCISEDTFRAMVARVKGLKVGMKFEWEGKGSSRIVGSDEIALIRKCMGNVAAARAALLADTEAVKRMAFQVVKKPDGSPTVEFRSGVASDFKEIASSQAPGLTQVQITLPDGKPSTASVDLASLLDVLPPNPTADTSASKGGAVLILAALAAAGAGAYILTRKK